jgi:dTDP-glucose pyrophosphorylase
MRILRAAGLDLLVITAAYLIAVVFRVGGKLELAFPTEAVAIALFAAAVQVASNAALGVYRRAWLLNRARDLVDLAIPAIAAAGVVTLLNLVTDLHGIPYAAIPIAATLAVILLVARRLRRRWRSILRAILGQREAPALPLLTAGAPDIARVLIPMTASIREAMEAIDRDVSRIALLVDGSGELVGTVTDGDARRAILNGISLGDPASTIMSARPVVATDDTSDDDVVALMLEHSIRQVPVVDSDGRVLDIKLLDVIGRPANPTPVLIMAGGRGTRLGEATRKLPKPLVQVGGRPILATLIRDLVAQGFNTITLAVGHKADLIERYFGDGTRFGASISYIREEHPLGTAGAVALAFPGLGREFIVTNADLLTRVNFGELVSFHRSEGHDLTIGIIQSTYQLRYGLVETDGSRVTAIREKPELRHFVNGGMYVLQPKLASLVPPDRRFDMNELIQAALSGGLRVGCFPIHEFWADIGVPADLKRASAEYVQGPTGPQRHSA